MPRAKRTAELISKDEARELYTTLDGYIEVQPAVHAVRIMHRFFDEVVDCPAFSPLMSELLTAYEKILNEELAPYALRLAFAITELEDAYPEIARAKN
jgi:hypothetical protein